VAGNFPGRGGSSGDVGHVGRSGRVMRLLRTRYGMLVTSATVGTRALWSVDWEEKERETSLSTGRGPACSSVGSTAERAGVSPGTPTRARAYGGGVIYSSFYFSENCITGVRRNVRTKFKFKFLKTSTVGCQDIQQGFQIYFCQVER
jgi:hypothetical protein